MENSLPTYNRTKPYGFSFGSILNTVWCVVIVGDVGAIFFYNKSNHYPLLQMKFVLEWECNLINFLFQHKTASIFYWNRSFLVTKMRWIHSCHEYSQVKTNSTIRKVHPTVVRTDDDENARTFWHDATIFLH